jgi:carboxypeptidase Taq
MRIRNKKVEKLLEKYKEIYLLDRVNTVLSWDLNVNLPPKASEGRATQIAYLTKVITEKWLDNEYRKLLEDVAGKKSKLTEEEKAIVRNLEHEGKVYFRVPKEIIVEFAETTSRAFMVWQEARKHDKFSDFLPHLKKIVRLNQIIAKHLGYKDNPYDALLDLFEQGLTAKLCGKIFGKLQPELTEILKKIKKSKNYSDKSDLVGGDLVYPQQDQTQIALFALRKMGYDLEAGRMDISAHPFTDTLGRFDIRITNRYKQGEFRESLMVAMHEGGHALYELGVNEEYDSTPLDGGVSLGIHESQSRFWENQVGGSYEFIKFMTPIFNAFYPEQLSKVGTETLFALFNQVKPSFIRVEADEVTYNLHIALRFELENGLINEKIKPSDLPEIWRVRMKKYLGVVPKTDRDGVLQDVHWSYGHFGYFPTYTWGNLYAAQFTAILKKELNLEELVERGELGTILSWLRTNIHKYGSLYWPEELIKKLTGRRLSPRYFLDYINKKYSEIYKLK